MVAAALTFDEMLRHNEQETVRWHEWFRSHTEALQVPIDIARVTDVRGMLLHIFAVELRYAERLLDVPEPTAYEKLPTGSVDELFGIGAQARAKMRESLERLPEEAWSEIITFPTRTAGTLTASKRKCFAHALLHSMRHWAQLATVLRQRGLPQEWMHDFLVSAPME
jgi:uncharacterized damage-inducible protein DinB